MTPDGVENIYQLSPMQEGMLFHSLYQPGADPYVDQSGCILEGPLDTAALRRAWGDLVARHPVLRTAFHWQELEHPLQVVFRDAETQWQEKDWRGLDPQAWQARLAAWLDDDRQRGFDLATAPLLRLTLIRESDRRYRFLWTHHHLILDGWSSPLVLRELFAAYASRLRGETPRLGSLPRPYADYIAWLQGRSLETAEAFWRRNLAGFSAATPLGLAMAIPADDRPELVDRELRLPATTTSALEELARRFRVTLSTVVHGAWALLLSRYSGRHDVLFGTVVSGRPPQLEGSETMVGLFINTVPVRLRLPPTRRLSTWLADLQRLQLEIREHEHAPLSEVHKWSDVAPGTPLFDTILAFENYPRDPSLWRQTGGLAVRDFVTIERTNYSVSLSIVPEQRLWLRLTHDRRRLSAAAMGRLLGHLATLLTAMTEAADGELRQLSMLTPAERRQILVEWNRNVGGESPGGVLHQLFEARAAELPEAVAVAFEDASGGRRELSYGALERRSAHLATRLAAHGVAPEARVGLALERSPELVLAILAVLRAGGAWVPLDPSYPRPRLAFMAGDAGFELVLASPTTAPLIGELADGARVLTLEMLDDPSGTAATGTHAAGTRGAPALPTVGPDHLAYVIYTSGSTGRPKGVMVGHGGAVSLATAEQRLFGAMAGDRVLAFASPSFDASVWEMWMALAVGATLELAAPRDLLPGPDLSALLDRRRISHLTLPPSALAVLPTEAPAAAKALPALRELVVAGEACPAAVAARFSPGRRFWNAYGPTETTVCATVEEVPPGAGRPPIGKPLDRTRAYVLGPGPEPMPGSVAGELQVGGVGVTRGYLGRPALTAERFVPDPFAGPGARLYRTGDRARWLADGRLEFLDRIDHQLKVRGYRIEPGEIETALATHPRVRDSVVVARPVGDGPPRLVAYVAEDAAEDAGELAKVLREHLRRRLPEHLVPALFVPLPALPRTPAGKVDRAALPRPPAPVAAVLDDAEGDPETWMRQLWAEVLQVEEVAADDDFFALGGDSILSIQLLSRLTERGIHLTPRQVFEHPTPAGLARAARQAEARRAEQGPVTGPLPLLPIQRWFFDRAFADPHHWNMALLVEIRGEVDPARLETALGHLADHHDGLRWRCAQDLDGVRAWIAEPGVAVPLTAIDLAVGDPEPTLAELQASLDFERGPMFRAALIERGQGRAPRLLLIFHHLVVDAVSLGILLLDLERIEGQLVAGEPVRLPPKTASVRELAEALEQATPAGELVETDSPGEPAPALPADVPAGEAASEVNLGATDQIEVELPAATTEALLNQAQEAYSTRVEEMLLAALARTFARHTGRSRLWLHLEGYGRQALAGELDLSRTVGWLTTLTPVLIDLEEPLRRGGDVAEVLKSVKEQLRAVPGVGDPGSGPGSGPLASPASQSDPQLSFNYLGRMDRMMAAADRFLPVEGPLGPQRSARGRPPHPLAINAVVLDGRLRLFWTYRPDLHRRATLETLAHGHRLALEEIVDHCLSPEAGGFTPSDFPAAELDQKSLDKFLSKLGGSR